MHKDYKGTIKFSRSFDMNVFLVENLSHILRYEKLIVLCHSDCYYKLNWISTEWMKAINKVHTSLLKLCSEKQIKTNKFKVEFISITFVNIYLLTCRLSHFNSSLHMWFPIGNYFIYSNKIFTEDHLCRIILLTKKVGFQSALVLQPIVNNCLHIAGTLI